MTIDTLKLLRNNKLKECINGKETTTHISYLFKDKTTIRRVLLPNATILHSYSAFDGCTNLEEVDIPHLQNVGSYAFRNCEKLTRVELPEATTAGVYCFAGCSNLESIYMPNLTSLGNANCNNYCFDGTKITSLFFPRLKSIAGNAGWALKCGSPDRRTTIVLPSIALGTGRHNHLFREAYTNAIDIGPNNVALYGLTLFFNQSGAYPVVILRRTAGIVVAGGSDTIQHIDSGSRVYVPSALIDSYKAANYWSAKGDIFYPIEGSEYEHYYANGVGVFQDVTRTLTNVTSSHAADDDIVSYGSTYSTTLIPSDGMAISSVAVTMGGSDITSTAYNSSTGVISINEVTGPITITAAAE